MIINLDFCHFRHFGPNFGNFAELCIFRFYKIFKSCFFAKKFNKILKITKRKCPRYRVRKKRKKKKTRTTLEREEHMGKCA